MIFGVGCAFVTSFDEMLLLRALQGISAAGLMVLPGAIIRDQFEGDAMARVFSHHFGGVHHRAGDRAFARPGWCWKWRAGGGSLSGSASWEWR